jgi:hypothetical protein
MLSTKTRSTIIALVASAGLAATSAPFTPVASASKNTGGYQKTVGKVKAWQNTCGNAQISFENALTLAEVDKASGDRAPAGPVAPVVPVTPVPPPKQPWTLVNVNATVLLWAIVTVPTPLPSVCRNSGTIAVAFVLLLTFAVVLTDVKISEFGSLHSAMAVEPLNEFPVSLTSVPEQPDVGETEVRCHADATCALARKTSRPSTPAMTAADDVLRMRNACRR